jgi:integrase
MSSTQNITKRLIEQTTNSTARDLFIRDSSLKGFGLKITPNNTKSFIAEARVRRGKPKRITLGRYPLLDLHEARLRAQKVLLDLKDGIDPIEKDRDAFKRSSKEKIFQDSIASLTLQKVFDDYVSVRDLKPYSVKDYQKTIHACFQDWLDKPIGSITRTDISTRHKEIGERGRYQANKAMRSLRSFINFASGYYEKDGQRLITENPVRILNETKTWFRETRRTRHLDQFQIFRFTRALISLKNETVRDYFFLLLFTGLRSNEALTLEWSSVDFDRKIFTVKDTKNRSEHSVPMSLFVYALFCYRQRFFRTSNYVFPGSGDSGHLVESRKQLIRIIDKTSFIFTPHDLRRTFATILEELATSNLTIRRLLNHKDKSVTDGYIIRNKAENYRKHLEAVANFIEVGHDWTTDHGYNHFRKQIDLGEISAEMIEGLQTSLYWSFLEKRDYDVDWRHGYGWETSDNP